MKHVKKWSAGIIFDHNKCHLDEEVLLIARSFVEKKAGEFWKKVWKHHQDYQQKKKDFGIAYRSIDMKQRWRNSLHVKNSIGIFSVGFYVGVHSHESP